VELLFWIRFNSPLVGEGEMPVTKYLERAREAAALADTMTGDDKKRVLEIAETWRKIAVIEADEIAKADGNEAR
jgi:hypothetical protein